MAMIRKVSTPESRNVQGHRREVEAGNIDIPVNSHALSDHIHPDTLPMERDYKFSPGRGNTPGKVTVSTHRCHAACVHDTAVMQQMQPGPPFRARTSNRRRDLDDPVGPMLGGAMSSSPRR